MTEKEITNKVLDMMTDHNWSFWGGLTMRCDLYPVGLAKTDVKILKIVARIAPTSWVIEGVRQLAGIDEHKRFLALREKLAIDKKS